MTLTVGAEICRTNFTSFIVRGQFKDILKLCLFLGFTIDKLDRRLKQR